MAKPSKLTRPVSPVRGQKTIRAINVTGPDPVLLLATNSRRIEAYFYNAGAGFVYIGPHNDIHGVALSAITGIPIATTEDFTDRASYDEWWGLSAGGAPYTVHVLEITER